MRRQIIHIVILLFTAILQLLSAFSQSVTLNFTCRDASNQYVQLNRIVINNLTKGWEETIWWPDTTLILQNGTGIQDLNQSTGFYLTQNIPNPFDGKTEVTLFTNEGGETILSVYDLNGSLIASNSQKLEKGFHQFSIQLAAAQSYLLTASSNGCRSSIKMVNSGGGVDNQINYLGVKNKSHFVKGESNKPFSFGDMMQYLGFGWINNTETESTPITQVQNSSQTITVYIPFSLPTIFTKSVSDITPSSAVCGGIVTSDGNDSVTARGVSWSTSQNPTINDNITADGSGMGSFTSFLTGLIEETTYYVRAYAINNAGIAYGAQHSFTTTALIQLPTVTTNAVSNITSTSVICGGNVTSDGGTTITARGVCWGTSQNPTVSGSHTTDGSGAGIFTSSITGLTAGTTYHVRAYATNSTGTAYGEQQTFTTTTPIQLPTVTTDAISDITDSSATCGGNVTSDGGANITARGVCWGTSQNPTISGSHTADGSDAGVFTSSITGLTAGTTYHVRAYATNSVGTAYGEQRTFTTTIPIQLPTVTTDPISDITNSSATCGGNVTSDGGATITARGVCWGTSQNPTISGSHTADGSDAGVFTSSITGLTAGTTYHVRAYATNSVGTAYGEQRTFTTTIPIQLPTVTTDPISDITNSSATCGGNVTSDGGATITSRGICWSTSQNPTLADNQTTDGSGTGSFSSYLTGLTTGVIYYVRAYAVNTVGTAYGTQQCFRASSSQDGLPCSGTPNVTDYDGNMYNTVRIGNQCWIKQSLRTTHYENGEIICDGTGTGSSSNLSMAKYYDPLINASEHSFGYLYNYKAVMRNYSSSTANPSGVQGICPHGWHVPSLAEAWQLRHYLETQIDGSYIAMALASSESWSGSTYEGTPGYSPSDNNASGFSALSAGYYNGGFFNFGHSVGFWCSDYYSEACSFGFTKNSHSITMGQYNTDRAQGLSVRCVLDPDSSASVPTVTTSSVTNINFTSATCGGYVTSYSGEGVTARGVCWSTSQNPTVNDSHTTDGNGTGSFTSSITGLTAGTTYYVRAYVTNSIGITSYGYENMFQTSPPPPQAHPCPNANTVIDYDGNVYNTVQIGNQCWIKENLRTTHYSDGTIILLYPESSTGSSSIAYRYYPNNDSSNVSTYGYLYNWKAVMRNSASSYTNPSFVQGVCPTGWHVPSISEWESLKSYVSMQSVYVCGNNNNGYNYYKIGKALAATVGWNTSTVMCTPGNNPSDNNATGLSAMPAGLGSNNFGQEASFWSTSENNNNEARCFNVTEYALDSYVSKNSGLSVRCVRDSSTVTRPSVTTNNVSNITSSTATCGGNVTDDGGVTVTTRGVCWSTSQNPTISDIRTIDSSGTGNFSSNLTGLASNATYYVRAYASNSVGTAYGNEVSFTTTPDNTFQDGQPCPGIAVVTDVDGNAYNTVQLGQQCWMKENLRTTKYADGTSISTSSNISFDIPYWYYPNNNSLNKLTYGLMYNWKALMRNSTSSNSVPSGVQGICPTGWHVPSNAEWTQLTDHVKNQSQYVCGSNNNSIAKALADTIGWNNSAQTCTPGYNPSDNNATGFSARPAGQEPTFVLGYKASFWSATSDGETSGWCRDIRANDSSISVSGYLKNRGHSVRCVKN